ncbi:alpha/beta hydrolase [Nonomuraea sp. NPDC052116]|uniref:alpha/beta fold hydrolase n=1 Tax=Nonomuraea sp. NPDC052116 TaxID=3155665 RepID=UPI003421331D
MNTFRHTLVTPVHTTSYLETGPENGPVLVFVHGWPGLASTWRHQLGYFAAQGYRVVAPDMRGYGDSTVHDDPAAYRQELVVADMLSLLDHLGRRQAVWIGHDWGSPTVWNLAAHFPERCVAVATLAVPFGTLERGWDGLLAMVDRDRYPQDTNPYGQFDYMAYYERHAEHAASVFESAPGNTVKALFRRSDPAEHTGPAPTSAITREGGWFGGASSAPNTPLSTTVLTERDFHDLTDALARNGFGGPTGYYLNHGVNARYADAAPGGRVLRLPVLFIGAAYDQVPDLRSPAALNAMRSTCPDLTEATVPAGHWLQMEEPHAVNEHIESWLTSQVAESRS